MFFRNRQAMLRDRGCLAAGNRFHELSRPLEDGDNFWADANVKSRRVAHHVDRRVVREQLAAVAGPVADEVEQFIDTNDDDDGIVVGQVSFATPQSEPPKVTFLDRNLRAKDHLYRLGCQCACAHVCANRIYFRNS